MFTITADRRPALARASGPVPPPPLRAVPPLAPEPAAQNAVTHPGNRTRPPAAPPRRKDNTEFAGMVRRCIRAHAARVAAGDPNDLVPMLALRAELDEAITASVRALNGRGFSWREIGAGIGMHGWHAWRKWHDPADESGGPS
jgi:hypothetical protein